MAKKGSRSGSEGASDASGAEEFEAAVSEVRDAPDSDAAWDRLEDVAASHPPEAVSAVYRELLSGDLPKDVLSTIGQRALQFHEEWFGEDSPLIVEVLTRLMEVDPGGAEEGFQRLTMALTASERWDELLDLYDRAIERADTDIRRQQLLEEAVQSAKDFAGRPDRAIAYLERLLELQPEDAQVAHSYERLLERQERWPDLIAFWRARVGALPVREARGVRMRIATLFLDSLRQPAEALSELRSILADPGNVAEEATALLERIVGSDTTEPETRLEALSLLRSQYDAEDRDADTVRAIQAALPAFSGEDAASLHREAAERLIALGRQGDAMDHYATLLRLDPGSMEARERLRPLADESGQHVRYVEALEAAADSCEDPTHRVSLRVEAADVRKSSLHDVDGAIALYQGVLREEGVEQTVALSVTRKLVDLYAAGQRHEEQLAMLEHLERLESDLTERRAVLGQVARTARELGMTERAMGAWESRLEADPKDREALDALVDMLEREEQWDRLVETLRRRIAAADQGWQRRSDLVRLAGLETEQRDNPEEGIVIWQEVARDFGEDPEVVDALDRLYVTTSRWQDLAQLLERTTEKEATHLAAVRARLGHAYRDQLGDPQGALSAYKRTLDADPTHEEARSGLLGLSEVEGLAGPACEALAVAYRATDHWEGILSLLEHRLAASDDPRKKVELLREAARLKEERAGDASATLGYLARAFALAPFDDGLEEEVMRRAESTGAWADAAPALREAATALGDGTDEPRDPRRVAHLRQREAEILEHRLGQAAEAQAAYASALRYDPSLLTAVQALTRTAEQTGDWDTTEAALLHAAASDVAGESHLRLLAQVQRRNPGRPLFETLTRLAGMVESDLDPVREAAGIAVETLQDAELALPSLERLYEEASRLWRHGLPARGEHQPAEVATWCVAELWKLFEASQSYERIVDLLVDASRLPCAPEDSRMWRRRAAQIANSQLGDKRRAIDLLRDVVTESPDDAEAMDTLAKLFETEARFPEILALRRGELEVATDPERRLVLRLEITRLFTEMERQGGRIQMLTDNLEQQPGHEASVQALRELLMGQGRYLELADIFTKQGERLEQAGEVARSAQAWGYVASLAEEYLGQQDRALEAHRKVVSLAPSIESLDALARMHSEREEHAQAARWLERRLAMASEEERTDAAIGLGEALLAAGKRDRAVEVLEEALSHDPGSSRVRELLAEEYRSTESWEPLARVLATATEHARSDDEMLSLVREAADLYHGKLGTLAGAVNALKKGVELAPDDKRLRLMYAEGLAGADELDEARSVLENLVSEYGRRRSAERAEVHHQLARVARQQGDLDAAIEQLETATKMDMGNATMLQLLGRLSREAEQFDRAERAYRALLLVARRAAPDEKLPVGAGEVLWELHVIAKSRGDEAQATELLESALETAAQSETEARRLKESLLEQGNPEMALRGLERRLAAVKQKPAEKAVVLADIADVLDGPLDRSAEAFDKRLESLIAAPYNLGLHDSTRELAQRLGRTEDYVSAMRDCLTKFRREEDGVIAAELLLRLGEVYEKEMGDLKRATDFYRKAEAKGEKLADAWSALARVSGLTGDHAEQRRALSQLVESGTMDDETRTDALYRLAAVQLGSAEHREDGVASLNRAMELDAQPERAGAILKAALEAEPDNAAVLALYEEVARGSGDDAVMLDYLERKAARPDGSMREVREGVERAEALGAGERAEALLMRGVQIARERESTADLRWGLSAMADRRRAAGDIPGALSWIRQAVETASDEDEAFDLQLRMAQLAASPEGDFSQAAETYEGLLERDPTDQRVWLPLLQVYRELGNEDRLNDVASATLDALLDPGLRNLVRMERAKFLIGVEERTPDAVDALRAVLEEEPDHQEATTLLTELYERSGYDEDLVELLERQLDVARDNEDLETIGTQSLRLGQLLEQVRRDDAIDVYRRALESVPEHREIIERLLATLGPEDDPRLRIEARERLLGVETGERAAELALQLYNDWQEVGDESGMQRSLELGYRGNPENDNIRMSLEEWYRSRNEWAGLGTFLAKEAARLQPIDPDASMERVREAAGIRRDYLGDPGGAVEVLREVYAAAPGNVVLLGELVASLLAAGDTDSAISEVGAALESTDEEVRGDLLRLRAQCRLHLPDEAGAVSDLEEAYGLMGSVVAEDLVDALTRRRNRAAGDGDTEADRAATMRLIDVLGAEGQAEQAREVLADWVRRAPDDKDALTRLKDVDLAAQNWDGVAEAAARLVQMEEGEAQVAAAITLADACEAAGRPADCRSGLEHVYRTQPGATAIVERLKALYETIGANAELAQMLLAEVDVTEDQEQQFELLRHAGKLLVDAGDAQAGLAALERATHIRPDDHQLVLFLADAYTAAEMFQEAGQLLERAIDNHPRRRSPELGELQHRMARLARAVGDRQLELQWLNAALDSDKNNGYVAAELATLAMEFGEQDIALNALRAVTLMKGDGPMSRAMAFLLQARIAHDRGESRRALLWARKAKSEDPNLNEADEFLAQLGDS